MASSTTVKIIPDDSDFEIQVKLSIEGDWQSHPLAFLREITASTQTLIEDNVRIAVAKAREQGRTWEEIGAALGVSRQSAWGRFSTED